MGVPLLGNSQLGTFYPPNWLVAPFSPPDGVRLSILLHVAWASVGTYLLARRTLHVSRLSAFVAALLFAFGGHLGGHVEQINQLQGLAWLPWLLYLFDRALAQPLPNALLLGMGLALQFFSGHTQTVFISAVALALCALCTRPLRGLLVLAGAGVLALGLALPQLLPTLELTRYSNRSGGLTLNQAVAFSFSPFVTGRGLLPSYDSLIFSEYVAYPGVIGLGLALLGAFAQTSRPHLRRLRLPLTPRATWMLIALVGLALAYGLYNPLYWGLASLPGFNLFRVPARWLALFALGASMLAALGIERLFSRHPPRSKRVFLLALPLLLLAAASLLTLRQNDQTPVSLPTPLTWAGWALALLVLLVGVARRSPRGLAAAALLELALASQILPYNALVPPDAYSAQRFTISQLLAERETQPAPMARTLSISNLLFDPGDRDALSARYAELGLSPETIATAFDTVKLREVLGANLPLVWGIPSADGYDGGVLPTRFYSDFTALLLPPGTGRSADGRLRELLALPECGGACLPDGRWLSLMNVRYLITDKLNDLTHEGIFFDTQFAAGNGALYPNPQAFIANSVEILCNPCDNLRLFADESPLTLNDAGALSGYQRQQYGFAPAAPASIRLEADLSAVVRAVTLVDTRTGDFQQLSPEPWTRILSSDIKIYRNGGALPRAFVVSDARFAEDAPALDLLRDPAFDPAQTVILAGTGSDPAGGGFETRPAGTSTVTINAYTATRVTLTVNASEPGYLILTDAYYPGWRASVNRVETPVVRADLMFRAVRVPAGESEVTFEYRPAWLPLAPLLGGAAWLLALITAIIFRKSKRGMVSR